jgi:hypothetical protein
VHSRCDSKHPVLMPHLRTAPGGARCWSTEDPEVAWRLVADLHSRSGVASSRPLGERSLRTFEFARPWSDSSIGCPLFALPDEPRTP